MDAYVSAVTAALAPWREKLAGRELATVYFGGGTPSLLGAQRLGTLLQAVRQGFSLAPGAEITLEANPTSVDRAFFQEVRQAGFNRLSMGLQSANEEELRFFGQDPLSPAGRPGGGKRPGRGLFRTSPWT